MIGITDIVDYFEEREGLEFIYNEDSFAFYEIREKDINIRNIYTRPEARKSDSARDLEKQIYQLALEQGKSFLTGQADLRASGIEISCLSMLHTGYKLRKAEDNRLYFYKEVI